MVLEVVLVVLGVVLVVLEVDNHRGHADVGTLDGLYQHTLIATGTI